MRLERALAAPRLSSDTISKHQESTVLFHVSEDPGIVEFIPRPSKYTQDPVVWAVENEKIRNYLVPRDCRG